ncbi:MAG: DoxX family protein [Bacteroidaceae bacterium]|nr:DoxX family protein [Bacteroidaceae bacterium]
MTVKNKSLLLTIAVNACRLLLAATFIFSGFVKANDPLGTVYKLEDYVNAVGWLTLPDTFLLGCAVILAFFEFTLGVFLLFGISRKKTSRTALAFMVAMTILTIYIVIANPVSDCGCFGDAIILSNEATLVKNIVLLGAAVLICRYYRLQKDFLSVSVKWFIAFVTLCFIIGYAIYCIICLPVFDFRPYKIGTNLRETVVGMSQQQMYDIKIVYEKDGKTLELTAEDDDPDSTWTYVETRKTPLETANLAMVDFYITDNDEEDITKEILLDDGYTFLLIIPDLKNADEGCVDKVNEVFDYAQDHDISFYCLTASSDPRTQAYWSEHTGAEYEYYLADERMLKTVVRAKPGLVLLRQGTILKKWSNYNMPGEEELASKYSYLFNE